MLSVVRYLLPFAVAGALVIVPLVLWLRRRSVATSTLVPAPAGPAAASAPATPTTPPAATISLVSLAWWVAAVHASTRRIQIAKRSASFDS